MDVADKCPTLCNQWANESRKRPGRMPPTERKRLVDGGIEMKVRKLLLIAGCRIVEWS